MLSVTLPLELWIIIIDLVIGALVNPTDSCTYKNFLEVDHYIRSPQPRSSVIPSYRQLRLVCRVFNDLLKTPPRFFMKGAKTNIPASTRALYICRHYTSRQSDPLGCLRRLLEDPTRTRRIVTLDIPYDVDKHFLGPSLFEILFKNSDLLSGVRNLAFDVVYTSESLLDTINRAFPALVCLVLRPSIEPTIATPVEEKRTVTFEKLEILDMERAILYDGIKFPLLRHVALGRCSRTLIETLSQSPLLESLLLRQVRHPEAIDLGSLHRLKLLGMPVYGENTVVPLPADYAHYLCVHVPMSVTGPALVKWVKKVPSYFPKLQQITLDLTGLVEATQRISIEGAFRCINLELEPSGLVINHLLPGSSYIVVERIVEQPNISSVSEVSSTLQSERSWNKWDTFLRTASRKLHL
jgi:hypothetical protein